MQTGTTHASLERIIVGARSQREYGPDAWAAIGLAPGRGACGFDNYHVSTPEQRAAVDALAEDAKFMNSDRWFIFSGNTGTGKKHLAAAWLAEKYKRGKRCQIINAKRLFVAIDDARNARASVGDVLDHFGRDIDVLAIDEIGRSTKSEAEINNLFEILDTRYEYGKQTLLISNMTWREMEAQLFDAALTRRIKARAKFIAFTWGEYKGTK